MTAKHIELWRTLRVGDKVRIPEMPPQFLQKGYCIFPETLRVYRKLVARGRPLRVYEIDEYGHPWVRCRFRRKNGSWEEHFLGINHGGLLRVKRRR